MNLEFGSSVNIKSLCATCLLKGRTISGTTIGIDYAPNVLYGALIGKKVGIGTDAPALALTIRNDGSAGHIRLVEPVNDNYWDIGTANDDSYLFMSHGSVNALSAEYTSGNVVIGSPTLGILSNPYKLNVGGSIHADTCLTASTRIVSPTIYGTAIAKAPILSGSTCAVAPIVCSTTCTIVGTNILMTTGAARCVVFDATSAGVGSNLCIDGNRGAASNAGGCVQILGGQGGSGAVGGRVVIIGGSGGNSAAGGTAEICGGAGTSATGGAACIVGGSSGIGGALYLVAGAGTSAAGGITYLCGGTAGGSAAGGDICIKTGIGTTCGNINMFSGNQLRLNTYASGVQVTGILSASTCFAGNGAGLTNVNAVCAQCSQTTFCVGTDIIMTVGAARLIYVPLTTSTTYPLCIVGQHFGGTPTGAVAGDVCVIGGCSTASSGTATGGNVVIVGGLGSYSSSAAGGTVYLCGGTIGGGNTGIGGDAHITGGLGTTCGVVKLHTGGSLKLATHTSGVCVTGTLNSSSSMCSTTFVQANTYLCSNTYTTVGTCANIGTDIVMAAGIAHCILMPTSSSTTYPLCIQGQCYSNSSSGVGGNVIICGGNVSSGSASSGGVVYICGGQAAGGSGTGTGGGIVIAGGQGINGSAICGEVCLYSYTTLRANTFAAGLCVTGCLNASVNVCAATLVCAPTVFGSTLVCGATVCGTTCVGGGLLTVCATDAKVRMRDSASPNLIGGLASEVGGQLLDYGTNYAQLTTRNTSYAGGYFRIDLRGTASYQCEFYSVRFLTPSGTETTLMKLSTGGTMVITGSGCAVDWIATSDCRLKTNIVPISSALSMVTQLQGVCYQMCGECENRIGLIAQDVQKILPEIVAHGAPSKDDAKYGITDDKLGLKYDKLTAVLIEAIKEQQVQIDELKAELNYIKFKTQ